MERTQGDILHADVEAIVNPVNCAGVMGRGLALQFKQAFPENYDAYRSLCDRKGLVPGTLFIFDRGQQKPRYIVNFPTKRHWRDKSRMEDIESGLVALIREIRERDIHSIAVPALGAGLGGLDWPPVRERIERAFAELPNVRALLYEPSER